MRNTIRAAAQQPFKVLAASIFLAIGVLCWNGWNAWISDRYVVRTELVKMRIKELQGAVVHLDEAAAMSARLAVATGDQAWMSRNQELNVLRKRAKAELDRLSPAAGEGAPGALAREASGRLEAMEKLAFGYMRQGRVKEAKEIIFGADYRIAGQGYGNAMARIKERIDTVQNDDFAGRRRVIRVNFAVSIAIVFLLLGAWTAVTKSMMVSDSEQILQAQRIVGQADELAWLNASLEQKVAERTVELVNSRRAAFNMMQDSEEARVSAVRAAADLEKEITARKASEHQLRQSQKIESIGRLAGGIAHDFNNILTAILGYSSLLFAGLAAEDPRREDVVEIQKAGDRAAALTRQLLAFSRQQVLQPRIVDLNVLVHGIQAMLRRLIGENMELATVAAPDLGRIKADPGQIEQVILNLVVNARDAMLNGGKIMIETRNVELGDGFAQANPGSRPGPHVMLAVSDTGTGMSQEVLSHMFEPFFTTKETGKGTGLGLSTVYGIVKQSGGSIYVDSALGRGSVFKVYLPRVEEDAEVVAAPAAAEKIRGYETILLVEDDASVRRLLKRLLSQNGYVILEAGDAAQGIRSFEERKGPIHLLLTDIVMPGMRGDDLAKRLAPAWPDMKVIFMSGYTEAGIVRHDQLGPNAVFIQKPLVAAILLDKVRKLLDRPAA